MIKRNIKLQVTPKESKQVQEICFANDIVWEYSYKEYSYTYRKFLYIDDHLTWGSLELSFKENSNEEVDATFFIKTKGTCVEENQEQELKQNIKEEQMYFLNTEMKKKNNEHKDVKEYLIAKGLYDRVMGIEWDDEVEEYECFSDLYLWANTEEDYSYWDEIDEELRDLGINMNIESLVQDYKAKQEQELKQNIEEEQMKDNEVETYKDVKEYLIAKGLYERVLEIDWETYEEDTFSGLFTWSETEEKHNFWNELSKEMLDLGIEKNIESLVQDYKAKQGKEFIKHIETKPLEKPKQYLCYVSGKALPKHIHKTLEQAKQEAQRLCRKELTKVSVLEVVAEYEAEVLVKEVL